MNWSELSDVQRYAARHLISQRDERQADGDWWQVPVLSRLRGRDVKRDVTVSIFANIENDLHNSEGLTVLLVPVVD